MLTIKPILFKKIDLDKINKNNKDKVIIKLKMLIHAKLVVE